MSVNDEPRHDHTWALVLAGGEGSRLKAMTSQPDGRWTPKQFCSLLGGDSLLSNAITRAATVVPLERICVVVTERHRRWWQDLLAVLPRHNILIQPQARGTAHGLLLPVLRIWHRDPRAKILVLPADHHVRNERSFAQSLRSVAADLSGLGNSVGLVGIEPTFADPELGYILPRDAGQQGPLAVARFVEKPSIEEAGRLLTAGALWNSFIMGASATSLLGLFGPQYHEVVERLLQEFERPAEGAGPLQLPLSLYATLQERDFSREVLHGSESKLRVWRVPDCGWSDLGTPERVSAVLRHAPRNPPRGVPRIRLPASLSLAERHQLMTSNGGRRRVAV